MKKRTILLTGATGYIGSHTWVFLLAAGFDVVGVDNLCNSSSLVMDRISRITGVEVLPNFVQTDVRDRVALHRIFSQQKIDAVIHFAALKAVGESVERPLEYYDNNLGGLIALTGMMTEYGVKCLAFSSSATVYGNPSRGQIREDAPLLATNPYAHTKLISEQILRDTERADEQWQIAYLRYFNPVGAHASGLIGEDPIGTPNNLMPYLAKVAIGSLPNLNVFGGDYDTPDGTGIRDYIHVMDLAEGHVSAITHLLNGGGSFAVNFGTGEGYCVLDMISAFESACGRAIPYQIVARRLGDIAFCNADPSLAKTVLGWQARRQLGEMCADSWRWQQLNSNDLIDA